MFTSDETASVYGLLVQFAGLAAAKCMLAVFMGAQNV
jgi:hypothetical protein